MNTFHQFGLNPEEFIRKVGLIINKEKAMEIVQKIMYEKTKNRYTMDIFTKPTLWGKLGIYTPMGHYNPTWPIVFEGGSVKYIYFIAETKRNDW